MAGKPMRCRIVGGLSVYRLSVNRALPRTATDTADIVSEYESHSPGVIY